MLPNELIELLRTMTTPVERGDWPTLAAVYVLWTAFQIATVIVASHITDEPDPEAAIKQQAGMEDLGLGGHPIKAYFMGVVAAPVVEESIFRAIPFTAGFIIADLTGAPALPTILAALLAANLAWAVAHVTDGSDRPRWAVVPYFLGGIPHVLAAATGWLLATYVLHAFHNAWAITGYFITEALTADDEDADGPSMADAPSEIHHDSDSVPPDVRRYFRGFEDGDTVKPSELPEHVRDWLNEELADAIRENHDQR